MTKPDLARSLEIVAELSMLDETLRAEKIQALSDTEPAEAEYATQLLNFNPNAKPDQEQDTRSVEPVADLGLFGNFELLEALGSGSQGVVWKARKLGLQSPVALKILDGQLKSGSIGDQPETRSATSLRHPNIVWVLGCGEHGDQSFIEMQFIEGQSLHQFAPTHGLSSKEIAKLMIKVVGAIDFAHNNGVFIATSNHKTSSSA